VGSKLGVVLYEKLFCSGTKKIAVLIDPDKHNESTLSKIAEISQKDGADFFLVGGSLLFSAIDDTVNRIKQCSDLPVLLFPGNVLQITDKADGILLLSLISGRNPELLIGNHVIAAPLLKKSMLEIIPTGYMLIDGGNTTSVEYMSNTKPIPADKTDIAVATALAGELTGLKTIYLEAGSGAKHPVNGDMIQKVKRNVRIPIIVGGGIRDTKTLTHICNAGADVIVIGTAFEKNPDVLKSFSYTVHES
jgi:putative glycerol-1-phosphate prenyltransferase